MPEFKETFSHDAELDPIEREIQQCLDDYYTAEYLESNKPAADMAWDDLARALLKKEHLDPEEYDVNYKFTSKKKTAELETINIEERTGTYDVSLKIRNKFAEGGEPRPKQWEFKHRIKVNPELLKKYEEKWSKLREES